MELKWAYKATHFQFKKMLNDFFVYRGEMFKISVIVTVYNNENYIARALSSIQSQTFKNFEVLIIDDGSTDCSYNIANEFCKKNERWKIFRLKHEGISNARIFGINNSKGEYLSFVDSDDFVEINFLKMLYEGIKGSQISICNYKLHYRNSKFIFKNFLHYKSGTFDKEKIIKCLILNVLIKSYLWNKLFKRSLFNGVSVPDMCFEDKVMCIQLLLNAKKITVIKDILYNYNRNIKSLTGRMDEKKLNDYVKSFEFVKFFIDSKGEYDKFSLYYKFSSFHFFFVSFRILFIQQLIIKTNFKKFFKSFFRICQRIISVIKTN
ncbi:MAG: glycosyltransferase [Firmicutes bacterium]|nr:glycosyltransferase [Bacillota bacterium]